MTVSQDDRAAPPQAGDAAEKDAVEARGGVETGRVRWMLRFGLVGAVAALGIAYLVYVSTQPNANPPPAPSQHAAQTEQPPPHGAM